MAKKQSAMRTILRTRSLPKPKQTKLVRDGTASPSPSCSAPSSPTRDAFGDPQLGKHWEVALIRSRSLATKSRRIDLVRDCPLPSPGEDGETQFFLPDELEERWEVALIRAPEECFDEMNLPESLERRWEQAWNRAPSCIRA
jgi:hypothetical protein